MGSGAHHDRMTRIVDVICDVDGAAEEQNDVRDMLHGVSAHLYVQWIRLREYGKPPVIICPHQACPGRKGDNIYTPRTCPYTRLRSQAGVPGG